MNLNELPESVRQDIAKIADGPLIDEVMELYQESHPDMIGPDEIEARIDFTMFYASAVKSGLKGIRWNFSGCIMCNNDEKDIEKEEVRRILCVDKRITEACGGRAFGTVICREHEQVFGDGTDLPDEVIDAVLKRNEEEPPDGNVQVS